MKILKLLPLIFLAGCAAKYDVYAPLKQLPVAFNQDKIDVYLLTAYQGLSFEQMRVIYLKDYKIISDQIIANGSINRVGVNGLTIVVQCTVLHCNRVVLSHNHPGQYFAVPSHIDLENADKFKAMMGQVKIKAYFLVTSEHDVNWL
jgi:DNA repair protein RadC